MNTATYNLPDLIRGNTLKGFSLALTVTDGGAAVVPSVVNCQIRTQSGRLIHQWPATVTGGTVTLPDVDKNITAGWPAETLNWQLEMTNTYGTFGYVGGTLRVHPEVAR